MINTHRHVLKKILVTDSFTGEALGQLRSEFQSAVHVTQKRQPTEEDLAETEGLLIRSRTRVDPNLLDTAPHLKLIITATSGFDHIDLAACQERKIAVMHTPEANAVSVCELTFGLLISLFRQLDTMKNLVRRAEWKDQLTWGRELYGLSLGILGLGRIGSRVAKVANCFGMHVCAYDPYQSDEVFSQLGVERLGLSEILMSADILSLHVPLTRETHHLINHQTLNVINREAILVNTSRGPVVNEIEVIEALELKQLGGLCLDVFEREPLNRNSKLLTLPNVTLSCHVGAFTEASLQRASLDAVQKMISWARNGTISDSLPPSAAWYLA